MIRSSLRPVVAGLVAVAVSIGALGACGGSSDSGNKVTDDAVNRATGMKTSHLKGKTKLDIAANSVTSVMSSKFSDYEINGNTVRLIVKDGAELSGSECTIITAGTSSSAPDATFVIDDHGKKTTC